MRSVRFARMESPLGPVLLVAGPEGLERVMLPGRDGSAPTPAAGWQEDTDALALPRCQLEEYFAGRRRAFELPLAPRGTPFQLRVWQLLREIPCGVTRSYGDLARSLGQPTASRAVGAANGRNPLAIVVPCHRVVGSDGSLTGYAGGLEAKRWLLRHEGSAVLEQRALFG